MERTDNYLDFRSATDGFRPVGLIGLFDENDENVCLHEYSGDKEKLKFIKNFLGKNKSNYELIHGWGHLYFVAEKSKRKDVEKLLEDHPFPIGSKEGEKRLGLLLGFPECCVNAHVKGEDIGRKEDFYVLPFAPCSEECERPWMNEYLKLAEKYNLDPKNRYINGNR